MRLNAAGRALASDDLTPLRIVASMEEKFPFKGECAVQLTKISGNSFFIPGPTNAGVFVFKDKYTLLIDSGDSNQDARIYADILTQSELHIKYILNTHEHHDHWGGNNYLQEHFPGSIFYASAASALFIENFSLFPLYIYGGDPPATLVRGVGGSRSGRIDHNLQSGSIRINEEKFDIISLPGHSAGQIGVATREKVCFLGDALFSSEILAKYGFPFLLDAAAQYRTLDAILELPYDQYVLGHADSIYTCEEIPALVDLNRSRLDHCMELLLDLLQQPKTREELLEEVVILEELRPDFHEYCLLHSTLGGMISYLMAGHGLELQVENGKAYYYQK